MAATLAGGRRPEAGTGPARAWARHAPRRSATRLLGRARAAPLGVAAASPFVPLALAGAAPAGPRAAGRRAARRAAGDPRRSGGLGEHLDALGARFDGRLRVAAVDRRSGRRVMFGAPGAPPAEVAEAVLASCAVPGVFAPVEIGGREYVDGGVWSPANLDAAPAGRGAEVLCLVPTARAAASPPLRAFSQRRRRGRDAGAARARRTVRTIAPDAASPTRWAPT